MPLDTEQLQEITRNHINGRPQRLKGPEVDEYLAELDKDIAQAKKDGYTLEIPTEIEVG